MKKVISLLVAVALLAGMSAFAMTDASASTTWSLPLDVTDENWHAETWDPAYAWNGAAAEVSDTIISESTADGIAFSFPEGGREVMSYPNVRYENAGGLIQVTEDDYINIKASCGEKDQSEVRWSLTLWFSTNKVALTYSMVEQGFKTINDEGKQLLGGDVETSIKISDAAKLAFEKDPSLGAYDGIWGAGGSSYLTGVVIYIYSNTRNPNIPLVIKALTIGDEGDFSEPGAAATTTTSTATDSTAASTADASTAASTAASSGTTNNVSSTSGWGAGANSAASQSKGANDSLSNGAIAGIIIGAVVVLAVIAVVVVLVVKKNKGGDAKADAAPAAKDDSAEK